MLPKELTGDLKKRLAFIKGQIEGITKMLDDDKEPDQILLQFKAADQALQNAHFLLLDEVFRKSLALSLVDVLNTCPGNCQDAEKIEFLQKQFPKLQLDEITSKMKEINEISERLAKYKQENLEK
jgi:CsoR family transcriptional regulator, copper-sensing transcriptional repressor